MDDILTTTPNPAKLTMRKVRFKRYIPSVYSKESPFSLVPGTKCWEKDFTHEGLFHQWAAMCDEGSENYGNYTVALVELPDGTIERVEPDKIQFINE